ncbi:hypothetical protein D4764_03G0004910 [Takifugu flavidus]|uniref:Uncharacterized protein n=1 Tax=Takifugu flavidus TaxID=433684 RepID=A0A5C6N8I9_9TELE|nr:hypothetical protein D4764_03G0004910 [Takifugu flavidus]
MDMDVLQDIIPDAFNNSKEKVLLDKLQRLVTSVSWSPTDAADLFLALLERFDSAHLERSQLLPWLLEILHLMEINLITPTWKCHKGTAVEVVRDAAVTDGMLKDYFSQEEEKKLREIIEEIRQTKLNHVNEALLSKVEGTVSSVYDVLCSKTIAKLSGTEGDLLRLCRAAERAQFRPRLTQMVSWCIMALSKTGQFIQVATGEGKSCIVAMFAAFKAMKGKTVHILSSSPILAERDMEDWKKLFSTLKISVDCNTNKHDIPSLQNCYKCQVVYGTADKFAGDYLTQVCERTDIFGQRKSLCAIVDEEDSIMLDKALHVIYMGKDMPALQHLNSLLAFIWTVVNKYSKNDAETIIGDEQRILKTIKKEVENSLHFTPCELTRDDRCCYVPGFLSGLVRSKINVWIRNALKAQKMTKDHEYVLEGQRIVPVDYNSTGVVENFMKWSDGLHQFLELKHKLKLSNMIPISNYMSNVGLLQKYGAEIFGLTGTLGQQAEMETLEKLYGIKTCQIPVFKRKKFFEVEGVIVDEETKWIETIRNVVSAQIMGTCYRGQRAALVICETIRQAKTIKRSLRDKEAKLFVSNNMDNREIFAKELMGGDIIIATNLAGRGTDFKVSDQALVSSLSNTSDLEINKVKNRRDQIAAKRLSTLLEQDIPNMKMKEHLFQKFLSARDKMPATSSKLELSALNEYWGFWLLTNSEDNDSTEKLDEKLSTDLDTARGQLQKGESPLSNLHYYTATGNELLKRGLFEQSILMYTKAILEDPCWAAFACYNRAFAHLLQMKPQDQNCIRQAMEDLQQARVSIELYWNQTKFTERCYKQLEPNPEPSISRLDHHMKTRQKVFMALKENIDVALKKLDRARAMGSVVKVDRAMVSFLVPLVDWLPSRILLAANCKNPLKILQLMSDASFDMSHELLGLQSLGLPYIYTLDTAFSLAGSEK